MAFTVTQITAPKIGRDGRRFVTTGFGENFRSVVDRAIWTTNEGHPGPIWSAFPVAFHYENDNRVYLELNGTFLFNEVWRAHGSKYRVTGTLGQVTIRSGEIEVPNNNAVKVSSFTFVGTLPAVRAPFKCAGNWAWSITHIPPTAPGSQAAGSVASATNTRIEAYFFQGSLIWRAVEVWRLIVKDLAEVNAMNDGGNIMISYAGHIVRTMWAYGGPGDENRRALQYDCRRDGGASAYGMLFDGTGAFQLGAFLSRERATCNCYDLAAILQVCCQSLGKKPDPDYHPDPTDPTDVREIPFIQTQWCDARPFGYIRPGPLFGLLDQPHCNNPFWKGVGEGDLLPYYDDPRHPDRTEFENHSFIEAYSNGTVWKVIDITHALQPVGTDNATLIFGQYTRTQYLTNSVEAGLKIFPARMVDATTGVRRIHNSLWEAWRE